MRKRRRLVDKLTIMVCAVLFAVSAFFYAPMEVRAEASGYTDGYNSGGYKLFNLNDDSHLYLKDYLDSDSGFYKVTLKTKTSYNSDNAVWLNNFLSIYNACGSSLFVGRASSPYFEDSFFIKSDLSFYFDASVSRDSTMLSVNYRFVAVPQQSSLPLTVNCSYSVEDVIVEKISSFDYESFQQGYNAGYSAGEQAGESNGYSNGYSDGYEAGQQNGYDSGYDAGVQDGFQSGQGSVDTQSYYDAGYNAGYDTGYLEGYDEGYNLGYDEGFSAGEAVGYEKGYESGWQAYEDKISGWGADTTQYPLLISGTSDPFDLQFDFIEEGSEEFVYSDYSDVERFYPGLNFNPNHTYKLNFTYHDFTYDYDTFFTSTFSFWLYWGSSSFPLVVGTKNDITTSVYISGDRIGNGLRFRCDLGQIESNGSIDTLHFYLNDCILELYDMGPSGDTQNHIANQTDQLTGGFNDSQGNSVNNEFSSGLNEFETAEDSLFATATTGLKDFTFFDIQSVPAMVTGMSFVGSIMSGWFTQAGGASGVGIVLSILFSIMLVAMVLGLYRWYQSKGGKD